MAAQSSRKPWPMYWWLYAFAWFELALGVYRLINGSGKGFVSLGIAAFLAAVGRYQSIRQRREHDKQKAQSQAESGSSRGES